MEGLEFWRENHFGGTSAVLDGPLSVQVPRNKASNLTPGLILKNGQTTVPCSVRQYV